MEIVAAAAFSSLGVVGSAWLLSYADRKKVRQIHASLGQSNGQGPVTAMNERQLALLARMEGQLEDILHWQGGHDAQHSRNN